MTKYQNILPGRSSYTIATPNTSAGYTIYNKPPFIITAKIMNTYDSTYKFELKSFHETFP